MRNILFLCTGNSCRSQMAEGWAKHYHGVRLGVYSAGIETHGLNPFAVKVMAEAGINISGQTSKHADSLRNITFDTVFTVCGHASESCPAWLSAGRVVHVGFDDPPKLAAKEATPEAGLHHYRRVRDEIRQFAETLLQHLEP